MPVRLIAIANLTGLLGVMTLAVGEVILSSRRDRSTYYEDHF
jgi:hypothetical protein